MSKIKITNTRAPIFQFSTGNAAGGRDSAATGEDFWATALRPNQACADSMKV
jgi:hypothetical protein